MLVEEVTVVTFLCCVIVAIVVTFGRCVGEIRPASVSKILKYQDRVYYDDDKMVTRGRHMVANGYHLRYEVSGLRR